ncbi:CLUMA_CG013569, isoform A [Clunio marinus]|uniref:CLUMA_CG013569, isoform A n=1 Tax=Clunio marinus TaxID=568069 RepID=A0A1J1IJC1_9DIPT|nr:CLUMA_CG013569, isoform A [Clunio marinus]
MGWTFLCCVCQPERSKKKFAPVTSVDLSRCNLFEIPMDDFDPGNLTELDLSYNKLDDLNPLLMRCNHLKVLNLSDNQLKEIPEALCDAFKHLQDLNLSHNQFEIIPSVIGCFQHIQCLDLSNNPIEKILDGTITELINLKELRLNSCAIVFLPANIGRLVNLETLELRENYLENLPPTIKLLQRLKLLDMGRNNFEDLPSELGQLKALQELILDENNLCDISVVGDLINLKHLDIASNRLDLFPEEVTNCTLLEILDGDGNDFDEVPDSIGNLVKLMRLNLNFVGLKLLPDSLGLCQALEEVKIQENYVQNLPSTIGLLRNLRILIAHDNCLVQLPDELASCVSLTCLNVANNQLTRLPDNIGHLRQLRSLNLMGNFLMYLPLSLGMLDSLEGLQLSAYQTGMGKPRLSQIEYTDVGIVLISPLLEQNYQPSAQKSPKKNQTNKIQFDVRGTFNEDSSKEEGKSSKDHPQITRIPTPTQKERKKLEKSARSISAEHQKKNDISKPFEIKEARVASTLGASYSNTPRQRSSIDPEYIELTNSSEFRPLTRPTEPPPYQFARQYSKMSAAELESFQKNASENQKNVDFENTSLMQEPMLQ